MTKGDFRFPFLDLSQMLAGYNVPGVDFDSIIETQRRNIDAFAAANQSAGEVMKTMGRRQVELFREAMEQWQSVAGDIARQSDPGERSRKQAEFAQKSFETAVTAMKEFADLTASAQREAFETVSKRVHESIDEMRGQFEKPTRK